MSFATKCWACESKNFIETVSREYCPDCGIECLYHGTGANEKYLKAMDRMHQIQKEKREIEFAKDFEDAWSSI